MEDKEHTLKARAYIVDLVAAYPPCGDFVRVRKKPPCRFGRSIDRVIASLMAERHWSKSVNN